MNGPLRRVALTVLVLFGALLANASWVQVGKGDQYRNDPRNSRVLVRAYQQERGPISVLNGTSQERIAFSQATDQRLKYLRQYPTGAEYAHLTGFTSLVYGTPQGIERTEDAVLTGADPRLFVGRLSDYVTGREPAGGSVVLTVNPKAQAAAVAGLQGKRGAVVALDPRTGAVLAMASAPSFDPARLSSHDEADIRAYYDALTKDPGKPLLNRAISQTYPPGSTFKVITAAAALGSGKFSPDSTIPSPRELALPQTSVRLKNFGGETCGGDTITLANALRISCNTAFAQLGLDIGEKTLRDQAQAFGLGDGGLNAPTQVATSVFPAGLAPPSLAQSAIGQFDVRVTPLQMALVAAGVANGGQEMSPQLVREVQAPDLARIDVPSPQAYKRATSKAVADQLTAMMELVVSGGTGTSAQIPGTRVAGKTGTAETSPGQPPHAWFIGFAPAEAPTVAVAVVLEDGGSSGAEATGGKLSAPIARDVMRAVLQR